MGYARFACCWHEAETRLGSLRVGRDELRQIDLHWHDLRHEAACRWLAAGLDLRSIQLLLGHADLKTMQRYLNVTDAELLNVMNEKLWKEDGPAASPDCQQVS